MALITQATQKQHLGEIVTKICLLVVCCLGLPTAAQAVVWDGDAGNGRWGSAANWSTDTVPNSATDAQFNATPTIASDIQLRGDRNANSLIFNDTDDSFSLVNGSGSRQLTLTSGDITRTSGSSGTQTLAFTTLALGDNADMNVSGSGSLVITSNIISTGGARSLTKSGNGVLVLSGNNTYSGGTVLSNGTLSLGSNTALGSGVLTINSGTISADGGSRSLANNVTVGGNFTIGGAQDITFTGSINLGGGTRVITVDNTGTTTFAGSVTEPWYSGLTKAGSGELVLSGSNSFSAPTTVSAGTLTLTHSNALGGSNWGNTVASGATLALTDNISINEGQFSVSGTGMGGTGAIRNLGGNNTLNAAVDLAGNTTFNSISGTLTSTGPMNLGGNTLSVAGGGNTTFSGAITNGAITKTDSGVLTLSGSGANSFGGTLAINDGTVALAKTSGTHAIGNAAVNIGDGAGAAGSAVLRLDASHQIADYSGLVTVNSDGVLRVNNFTEGINRLAGTGLIDLSTSGYLAVGANSGSSTFGGSITGTGTFAKTGSGNLTLTQDIDFNGTFKLDGGTLTLSGISLSADTLLVTSNSIIDFAGSAALLDFSNFTIADGVTLTLQNWAEAADYFFTQNWSGAVPNTTGSAPMNQVVFSGFSANDTRWQNYDNQITPLTPVPEPATYGALLLSGLTVFTLFRRFRHRADSAAV